eukprot:tig00000070_g24433.t1
MSQSVLCDRSCAGGRLFNPFASSTFANATTAGETPPQVAVRYGIGYFLGSSIARTPFAHPPSPRPLKLMIKAAQMVFGGRDLNRTYYWAPIASDSYWAVPLANVTLDGRPVGGCGGPEEGVCFAVIDSGTSLLAIPEDDGVEIQRILMDAIGMEPPANFTRALTPLRLIAPLIFSPEILRSSPSTAGGRAASRTSLSISGPCRSS